MFLPLPVQPHSVMLCAICFAHKCNYSESNMWNDSVSYWKLCFNE